MLKLDLAGEWMLQEAGTTRPPIQGSLPGCTYLDLMANGKIPDPFWGTNEAQAQAIAEKDFEYSRHFDVPAGLLEQERVDLVVSGLDTLATIWLNETKIAETDNAQRTYRFPVKNVLKADGNGLRILFKATRPYLRMKLEQEALPSMDMGVKGVYHLRKPACHFGWDWGPNLPPAGISGAIGLEAYSLARLREVRLDQKHTPGQVALTVRVGLDSAPGWQCNRPFRPVPGDGTVRAGLRKQRQPDGAKRGMYHPNRRSAAVVEQRAGGSAALYGQGMRCKMAGRCWIAGRERSGCERSGWIPRPTGGAAISSSRSMACPSLPRGRIGSHPIASSPAPARQTWISISAAPGKPI